MPGRGNLTAAVGDRDNVGGEHVQQTLDVARVERGQEPVHYCLLLGWADLHSRTPPSHVVTGAVGDLPYRRRRLANGICDLVVRRVEDLAQHEHRALGRFECLQHGEHRHRAALGEHHIVGDVGAGQHGFGQPLFYVVLPPPGQRPKAIERLPGDDPHQVGARVAHLVVVDVEPP
jgi:hypothetical protein